MLEGDHFKQIIRQLPKFKLSYETMIHKKVYANLFLAIPRGDKCFAWFTTYNKQKECFIMKLNEKSEIINVRKNTFLQKNTNSDLCLGTLFYGTIFQYNGTDCFTIEDIYFHRGDNVSFTVYEKKLEIIADILQHDNINIITTVFGLPLMSTNFNSLLSEIEDLPYKISQIKFRYFDRLKAKKILYINYFKPKNVNGVFDKSLKTVVFRVTADLEPDIYNLLADKGNGEYELYDVAAVPTYNTSVMMNKLFRNIKENDNLDALEESDDEDEFENTNEDKFVYLDRSFDIRCTYNAKFRKWVPVSLANSSDTIIQWNQLAKIK